MILNQLLSQAQHRRLGQLMHRQALHSSWPAWLTLQLLLPAAALPWLIASSRLRKLLYQGLLLVHRLLPMRAPSPVGMQQWRVQMLTAVRGLTGLRPSLLTLGKLQMQLIIWSRALQPALELLRQRQTW